MERIMVLMRRGSLDELDRVAAEGGVSRPAALRGPARRSACRAAAQVRAGAGGGGPRSWVAGDELMVPAATRRSAWPS
ncbi:MAG: hypothetical protein ACYDH5_14545 [Acidimicrobiales bacterium]